MATKPSGIPGWVPTGADVVVPSAGEKTSGFQGTQRPPAQYVNWFWELSNQWMDYLNDGDFQGAATFDNTLNVTGLITADAGVTATSGQSITVSGAAGRFKHGEFTKVLGPSIWYGDVTGTVYISGTVPSAAEQVIAASDSEASIPLDIGERIKEVSVHARQSAAGTLKASLFTIDDDGTLSSAIGTATSTTTGAFVELLIGSLTETIAVGKSYFLRLESTGTGIIYMTNTYIKYDHP